MGYISELEYFSAIEKHPKKTKEISEKYESKAFGLSTKDFKELDDDE